MAACAHPTHAVIYLTSTGWEDDIGNDPGVGTWDPGTLTGTLTQGVSETIQINNSGVTLDGGGNTVTGPGSVGNGVQILDLNGITVRNINITGFATGIYIQNSNLLGSPPVRNTFENNTITNTTSEAIRIYLTNATVVSGNNISNNHWGIQVDTSGNGDASHDYRNYVSGNTLTDNAGGIWLRGSNYNNVEANTATGPSFAGIYLSVGSSNNVLTGNATSNNDYGIKLNDSSNNTITNNNLSNNTLYGIWLDPSNSNQINNNNFITNATQAYVDNISTGNNFDGNYWSDWDPDVTTYYEFTGGKDNAPWSEPYGWIEHRTPLRIIPPIINREGRLDRILAVMRFPAGTVEEDIDIGQNLILYPGDSLVGVEATSQRVVTWCRWGTLRVSVFACFNKDEVTALIPEDGPAEMMVIGRLADGQYFYGLDDVRIISWSWGW